MIRTLGMAALFATAACFLAACGEPSISPDPPTPPDVVQRPYVVSAPGGDRTDPYYWLRDDNRRNPELLALLEAENDYSRAMLAEYEPLMDELVAEMRERVPEKQVETPYLDGGYWYYTRYEKGNEYPIYARRKETMAAPEQVLLDGNSMAAGGDNFRIGGWDVSPDGRRLVWLQEVAGRRQFRMMTRDLGGKVGTIIDTGISGVSSASWSADGGSIFYVENHPETLRPYRVRRHVPGSDSAGEVVYEELDDAFFASVGRTRSDRFSYIFLNSTIASEMRIIDGAQPETEFEIFFPREQGHEYTADHAGGRWVIRTNWQAPNFRIMRVEEGRHADRSAWVDIVAHRDDILIQEFDAFDEYLAISERADGQRRLRVVDLADDSSRTVEFDQTAYVVQLGRNPEPATRVLQFAYTSMTTPRRIHELDMLTGEIRLVNQLDVGGDFNAADYRTRRIWAEARDGTRVPVSIAWHEKTPLNGSAPLYQEGYGAYGTSMEPAFSSERISLLDRGFVYAIAHVRGGQEMGRDWYEQGRLRNKINTFNDFIDVTDFLVEHGFVDGNRVFATGGSAGGLLVGAVANMAPQKYAGIVANVPFVDVVTTMLDESIPLTTIEFDEWGNPKNAGDYRYMLSYSPYDNVERRAYPPMLVTAGLWDSQVQYWEPLKWVAKLRDLKTDENPMLLHVDMDAGHGGQSGRFRQLRQTAMEYAFVLAAAGLD